MPYYADLNPLGRLGADWARDEPARQRTISGLLKLRQALSAPDGPPPKTRDTLLLATWNLREFDSSTWGDRLPESYAYIAEIISRFDLVAIQEVRDDLTALERLRSRLGKHWSYLGSDVTEGGEGNHERLAFLYDTRSVQFLGIAGELVLPPVRSGGTTVPSKQVARTPMMAAFQVGWTKFVLTTVHILYGESTAEPAARVEEIAQVARSLRARTENPLEPIHNFILLGDFNIFTTGDKTMKALTEEGGFTVPDQLLAGPGSNLDRSKKYDQIAFRQRDQHFEATGRAGVFDYYPFVFAPGDRATYRPYVDAYIAAQHAAGKKSPKSPTTDRADKTQFDKWKTYQMSDHLPLWAQFRVDFSDEYLRSIQAPPPE